VCSSDLSASAKYRVKMNKPERLIARQAL
jgi:hypothetical protein